MIGENNPIKLIYLALTAIKYRQVLKSSSHVFFFKLPKQRNKETKNKQHNTIKPVNFVALFPSQTPTVRGRMVLM